MAARPPPRVLALEASAGRVGVAVLVGERVAAERCRDDGPPACEVLLPLVDEALREAALRVDDLDAVCVSVGPGSFTGVRVAVATAKGLALGGALAAVPVSSLAALAEATGERTRPVAALLDARRGELYAAVFRGDPAAPSSLVLAEGVYTPQELAARLPRGCLVVGEGLRVAATALTPQACGIEMGPCAPPDPAAVGRLGVRGLAAGGAVALHELMPRYVRRAEAEVRRTGLRFEG